MILRGDCLHTLKTLADNSVDSIVTDPPYGLSFMGKKWDYDVPSTEIWREAFRVLKPGGHLLSFFGTRTYHRGVIKIEDAGFEIRDQIMWIYGSGFPKSTDVSKRIDKEAGAEREVIGISENNRDRSTHNYNSVGDVGSNAMITAPSTNEAKQWQGWGSSLKPANEPIVVARKPLEKGLTVAQNVLKWGCGGINIDASRISANGEKIAYGKTKDKALGPNCYGKYNLRSGEGEHAQGRWPANILFDESAADLLDLQSGILKSGELQGYKAKESENVAMSGKNYAREFTKSTKSEGGASRFFYVAKSSKRERGEGNNHPTVKPIKLMEYLIKLVTPPNGTVLDPFMGSGSTGVAAKQLGFGFIGCEMSEEYIAIAKRRIENTQDLYDQLTKVVGE